MLSLRAVAGPATLVSYPTSTPDVIDQALETVPSYGQPTSPAARPRANTLAVVAVSVVAIVATIIADLVTVSPKAPTSKLASTASARIIVPAPAAAGGLLRDYDVENSPSFKSGLATIRQHYLQVMHTTKSNLAVAVYAGALPQHQAQAP